MAAPDSPDFARLPLESPLHSPPSSPSPPSTPLPSYHNSHATSPPSSPLNPQRSAVTPTTGDAVGRSGASSGSASPKISRSSTGARLITGSNRQELDQTTAGQFCRALSAREKRCKLTRLRNALSAVLTGAVGGSFGPFPRSSSFYSDGHAPFLQRDSRASSTSLLIPQDGPFVLDAPYRLGSPYAASGESISLLQSTGPRAGPQRATSATRLVGVFAEQDTSLLWNEENKEPDDYLYVRTLRTSCVGDRRT